MSSPTVTFQPFKREDFGKTNPILQENTIKYTDTISKDKPASGTETDISQNRDATLYDLTINSFKKGYTQSLYGQESYKAMMGQNNSKAYYEEKLKSNDYSFIPDGWFEEAISGGMGLLGQQVRQWTDPRSLTTATTAAGVAALAGQAGPQVLAPEEIITVPGAFIAGMTAGSSASNFEIEAGLAYNEMIDMGISHETARNIALGVGMGNAALEALQLDDLVKSYKILNKTGTNKSITKKIGKYLIDRGIHVASETLQEDGQEAVTMTGVNIGSKIDKGEWAYDLPEMGERLLDTTKSSALSFGLLGVGGDVINHGLNQIVRTQSTSGNKGVTGIFDAKIGTSSSPATQEQVNSFIDYAIEYGKQTKEKGNADFPKQKGAIVYAVVSDKLVKDLQNDVDVSGMKHYIYDNDIRHIINSHGENTNEKYPVTANDLKQIPDIVENYDDVLYVPHKNGAGIYYVKQHNGVTYYLEAISKDGILRNKQMIKVSTGTIPDITELKNAINKKWHIDSFQMTEVPRMYVQDARNHIPSDVSIPHPDGIVNSSDEAVTGINQEKMHVSGEDTADNDTESGKTVTDTNESVTENNDIDEGKKRRLAEKVNKIKSNSTNINEKSVEKTFKDEPRLVKSLKRIGKGLGVNIRLFNGEALGLGSEDGFYDKATRTMYLNYKKPQKPIRATVRHEVIHVFRQMTSKGFNAFSEFVVNQYKKNYGEEGFKSWIQNKKAEYADLGIELDDNGAIEELCADFGMDIMQNKAEVKAFIVKDMNAAKRLQEVMRKIANTVRRAFGLSENITGLDAMAELAGIGSTVSTTSGRVDRQHTPYGYDGLPETLSIAELQRAQELLLEGIAEFEKANKKNSNNMLKNSSDNGTINNIMFSAKEKWRPDISKKKLISLMQTIENDIKTSTNNITDKANWLLTRIDGMSVFAIYSTEDVNSPTLLYESKGEQALYERDILLNIMEAYENEQSSNRKSDYVDWVSKGGWMQQGSRNDNDDSRPLARESGNRDAGVLRRQSKRNTSPAFDEVIRNIFKVQERVDSSDSGITFSATIPKGENPARDIDVPAADREGKRQQRWTA